jgi:hypothetical protein
MTPLIKEMIKLTSVSGLDPTQMQWFDVTGAIKEYIGYDQRKYLLHPALCYLFCSPFRDCTNC